MEKLLFGLLLTTSMIAGAQPADYDRSEWRHWQDFDRDCQNTRHELLIRESLDYVTFTNDRRCSVATGRWVGPYTGLTFTRASDVDIDHIIPLKYAHDHGGAEWGSLLKMVYANDPENLLVTEDNANQSKGAKGPSEYLPREEYQCEYAKRWDFLASKYELNLDSADINVIEAILDACL